MTPSMPLPWAASLTSPSIFPEVLFDRKHDTFIPLTDGRRRGVPFLVASAVLDAFDHDPERIDGGFHRPLTESLRPPRHYIYAFVGP